MEFLLSDVAAAASGQLLGSDEAVSGASIDSRTIEPGQMFVAVVAERDGHEFAAGAVDAGATGLLVERQIDLEVPQVLVADTEAALALAAAMVRPHLPEPIVGVTGSVGKTSAKDLIAAAFGAGKRTHASYRSFNNDLGVPLTLLNTPPDSEAVVVEMGARGLGHIARLCDYVQPTIGVVTRVGAAHTEMFGSLEGVATAKGELIEALPVNGVAVLNADDPRVVAMAGRTKAEFVTYGLDGGDVTARDVVLDDELRSTFTAVSPWGETAVRLSVAGLHNVSNALCAVAAAGSVGVDLDDAAAALVGASMSPWRMDVGRSTGRALIINDAYNANPMSVDAALRSLAAVPADRRVAVLGTMAELGDDHASGHLEMADLAQSLGIDLIAFDEDAYGPDPVRSHDEAMERLGALGPTDAVLVKGSRVAGLELLAERLLA